MVFLIGVFQTTCMSIYKKTSIMWIGTWKNLLHMESLDIYLENEIIKQVDTQKLLGLSLTNL